MLGKALQTAAAGSAAGGEGLDITDAFSTYLYTGNGSSQTITNGIDLAGEGGLVWLKSRSSADYHFLTDTVRGATKTLYSNATNGSTNKTQALTAFTASGFSIGIEGDINRSGDTFASWTFRRAPKFFDVVTWTGDGTGTRSISHSLGSIPGVMIWKKISTTSDWIVYHRSLGTSQNLYLNQAVAAVETSLWGSGPTSTNFPAHTAFNALGETYVAYLFAHDAGGFGDGGTESVIKCGSFTGSPAGEVSLGWEPQWVLLKNTLSSGDWLLFDTMRGLTVAETGQKLAPNNSNAEALNGAVAPTATGFKYGGYLGGTYIYIAIRRGPMKQPESGTEVFYANAVPQADKTDSFGVPFPPDLVNTFSRNGSDRTSGFNQFVFADRLRGLGVPNDTFNASAPYLISSSTGAENAINQSYVQLKADGQNITRGPSWNSSSFGNYIFYFMRRAPGFFDIVTYTGTGSVRTVPHNLGVAPELMLVKSRSASAFWRWYWAPLGATQNFYMPNNEAAVTQTGIWNDTTPTSTVFTVGTSTDTNFSARTYIAYLFASCPGVSKVGSYTGTGTTLSVDCGFASGSRLVLIKRTDSTGSWYIWDSARGIVSGNDPYLLLNSTAAEVTSTDYIDPLASGFQISSTAPAEINASGGSYIFLAIS